MSALPHIASRSLRLQAGRAPLFRATEFVRVAVASVDAAVLALAFLAATAVRYWMTDIDLEFVPERVAAGAVLMMLGLGLHGAYDLQRIRNGQELLIRLMLGIAAGLGFVIFASYAIPEIAVGRGVLALYAAIAVPLLLVWRRFLFRVLREQALRPRAIVLGEPGVAARIARALSSARYGGAEVVGIVAPAGATAPAGEDMPPLLGSYESLRDVARAYRVGQVIVVSGAQDAALPLDQVLELRREGVAIEDGTSSYEATTGKLLVEKLTPGWLIFANAFESSRFDSLLRRVVGAVLAGAILLVLSPLLLLVAIAVRLDSPGPIIFRQRRVGEGGRTFDVLKFRTMRQDAEAKTGAVWAQANDPRVTRVGRILRSTRLDELPQLWNVLRGDMYFVGPRPERPEFVEMLRREIPHYDQRHAVKPGITGWAQINYRYGASIEDAREKLHYDLYYIQNKSFLLDLDIVVGTLKVMARAANDS